ncbi:MAG: hypothetical protein ACYCY2_05670 [Acidithiobacillus ferriphilus]
MTTEAEEKKLEAADAARVDGEGKDNGEDPTENTQGQKRADEGQGEEIPAWADSLKKGIDSIGSRMDAIEKDRKDAAEAARPVEADAARKDDWGLPDNRRDASETEAEKARKDAEDKAREDSARKDAAASAATRAQTAKIAELEARLNAVYLEPTIEDRNLLAETRNRADGLYQALTGQPASSPQPGESPIGYRKRMADGLRKYSERMKEVRLDALAGEAFAVVEDHIYTDAHAAIRSDAIVPAGQLRAIKTMDRGRERTEYVGDSSVTWAPFMAGAYRVGKLNRPVH